MLMATEPRGSIGQVRKALEDLQRGDFVGYNEGIDINAEIDPELSAVWLLVETVPGLERIAASHLAARRFGIFVPDIRYQPKRDKTGKILRPIERGAKLDRSERMFVGYIFVFMWLTDENWRRIHAIPAVRGVVRWPDERIATFTDSRISQLRTLEAILSPIEFEFPANWVRKRKRYGWRHDARGENNTPKAEKVTEAIKGWVNVGDEWIDTIEALHVLDGRDENRSLAKALGLASQ